MQGSRLRQGIYSHYNKLNKKGYFSTPTRYLGFSLNNCDPITVNSLALVEDSNLIRITN